MTYRAASSSGRARRASTRAVRTARGSRRPTRCLTPRTCRLRTWVNGELRQETSTSDLIFGVDAIVAFLSEVCTLEPGDLILTGTPSGVGIGRQPMAFLGSGDVVRIEIESLGSIEHAIA